MTAQIPSDDQAHASRAVLLDVLTILGLYLDGIVVIGGWVQELMSIAIGATPSPAPSRLQGPMAQRGWWSTPTSA